MTAQAPTGPNGYPLVRGTELLPTTSLPDKLRSVFPFRLFNIMQSKCFPAVFRSSDNFVLSSPTGSGKTVVLELAICRLLAETRQTDFKIIYQAPLKALCSERLKDWQTKFQPLGLKVAELTGDSENSHLSEVKTAHIIITTPEKWDSITRKWKDHLRLMELVKLFLIDEVHLLKEDRGASLEAVVSRMKSRGSDVRFIALSATVPNSDDIASWLGKNASTKHLPASTEVFDETYRPVKLEKHVYGYNSNSMNEFQFEQICNKNLTQVISRHSIGRPILIFCGTRKSTESTAQDLVHWWRRSTSEQRRWEVPLKAPDLGNKDLQTCVSAGVAFHHAGIDPKDRQKIQQAYLDGIIHVICCTSTLAVGVNLPAHFVIVKNTVTWQQDVGSREHSDIEIMQMLGRAGRPQFDRYAVAVIMTRAEKVQRYEKMVSGQQTLESRLHLNLYEHLNSEIGLGTIHDVFTAIKWLEGTFLWTRLKKNPSHYCINGDTPNLCPEDRAQRICAEALEALDKYDLISKEGKIRCTQRGEAMTRYYVQFETMKLFASIQPKARMSELLSAIAQASEFKGIRLRGDEKALYKEINQSPLIKWRIPVDIALTGHKISLIIQATLGGVDVSHEAKFRNKMSQLNTDRQLVFQHACRLARCIIHCELAGGDSITVRNAMELSRSLGARAWDDSPLQLGQLPGIGPVAVRKLVGADIRTVEDLETTEPHRIEMLLSRNPPFGREVLAKVEAFPKPRVSLKLIGHPSRSNTAGGVDVSINANIGFINEKPPRSFSNKPTMVCMLAESSDGKVLCYYRANSQSIGQGENVTFQATLKNSMQLINCYISCEDIAGTLQHASLAPKIPASLFQHDGKCQSNERQATTEATRLKAKVPQKAYAQRKNKGSPTEDFVDIEVDYQDLLEAMSSSDFPDIDSINPGAKSLVDEYGHQKQGAKQKPTSRTRRRLPNGKWECNHSCKNKDACRHLCCNEGLDKAPVPSRAKKSTANITTEVANVQSFANQTKPGAGSKTKNSKTLPLNMSSASCDQSVMSKGSISGPSAIYSDDVVFDDELLDTSTTYSRSATKQNSSRDQRTCLNVEELDLTSDDIELVKLGSKRSFEDLETVSPQNRQRKRFCSGSTQNIKQNESMPLNAMRDLEVGDLLDEQIYNNSIFSDERPEEYQSMPFDEDAFLYGSLHGDNKLDMDEYGSMDLDDTDILDDLRMNEAATGTDSSIDCSAIPATYQLPQDFGPCTSAREVVKQKDKAADYEALKGWALEEFGDMFEFVD